MIKHKHHIIPRHVGGTDDPSNIVELTIEEHAEAHRILYEKYGRNEDKWAWLGLSGQIGKDEILKLISMAQKGKKKPEGFGEKISFFRKTFKYSEESKLKMSLTKKGKIFTKEHREKISLSQIGRKQTEQQKQKVSEKLQLTWTVTEPNGKSYQITNLRKFCLENNLDQGNMVKVSKGILKKHKGWTCFKVT
jgi:hypothetical protein